MVEAACESACHKLDDSRNGGEAFVDAMMDSADIISVALYQVAAECVGGPALINGSTNGPENC